MIEFKPGCYYVGIWFADGSKDNSNWLGVMWQDEKKYWHIRYRFRYDEGTDDPFDGKDRKSWYALKTDLPFERDSSEVSQMKDTMHKVAGFAAKMYESTPQFAEIEGDMDKGLYVLAQQPWAHVKEMSKEQAESEGIIKKQTSTEDACKNKTKTKTKKQEIFKCQNHGQKQR